MRGKMAERDQEPELKKAFGIFANGKDQITFEDLKSAAQELGEDITDDMLKEMLFEANRCDREGVVTLENFMSVL